ncbi:hypothetical protein MKX03_020417, partial [Papaver bracteatum]
MRSCLLVILMWVTGTGLVLTVTTGNLKDQQGSLGTKEARLSGRGGVRIGIHVNLLQTLSALRHSLQDRLSKSVPGKGRADEIYLKLRTST